MRNPVSSGMNIAATRMPEDEPHHRGMDGMTSHPQHKAHKVTHRGRPPVEMPRGHGMRASAAGRDRHRSSDIAPRLPGLKEKGRVLKQRVM